MAAIFLKTIIFSCLRCYKNKNKHIYELIEQTTIAMCLLNLKKNFEWNPSNRFCVIPGTSSKNVTLGKRHSKIWNKKKRFLSSSPLFSDTRSINFSFLIEKRLLHRPHIYTQKSASISLKPIFPRGKPGKPKPQRAATKRLRKTKRGRVRQQITIEILHIMRNPFEIIFLTLYRWEICKKKNRFFLSDEPEDPLKI